MMERIKIKTRIKSWFQSIICSRFRSALSTIFPQNQCPSPRWDQIKIKSVQSDFIGLPQIEHVEAVPKKGHHAHVTRWQDAEQREMVRRMVRRILRK